MHQPDFVVGFSSRGIIQFVVAEKKLGAISNIIKGERRSQDLEKLAATDDRPNDKQLDIHLFHHFLIEF